MLLQTRFNIKQQWWKYKLTTFALNSPNNLGKRCCWEKSFLSYPALNQKQETEYDRSLSMLLEELGRNKVSTVSTCVFTVQTNAWRLQRRKKMYECNVNEEKKT